MRKFTAPPALVEKAKAKHREGVTIASFLPKKKQGKFKKHITQSKLDKLLVETEGCIRSKGVEAKAWVGKDESHLVALYYLLHKHVYGVEAEDCIESWQLAQRSAKSLVEKDFNGSLPAAVKYVTWAFGRQKERDSRQVDKVNSFSRLSWRTMFTAYWLLTDYRVFAKRAHG